MQCIIGNTDICGLGETMQSGNVNLYFEGYEIIVVNGTKKFRQGRASGGFMISIKQEIFKYVEVFFFKY